MQKFNSIEQFRHVIKMVRDNSAYHGLPIPTITFEGTVKLHGTNAGVRVYSDRVQPQSRERLITIEQDNAGFAVFAFNRGDVLIRLANAISGHPHGLEKNDGSVTIFGEWCGGNIQSKVGLNNLDKHFVVFGAWDHANEQYFPREWMREVLADQEYYNLHGIHFIYEIPTYEIVIDFTQPEQYIEELERLTLEVEEACPWATYRGASGIGEGIVWVKKDAPGDNRYWFKTKGVKHQGKGESKVKTLNVDPVKVAAIRELVDQLLPDWRLEQGVTYLRENGYSLDQKATGQFLQWVMKDVLKEESDTITANAYEWKALTPHLTTKARDWYFQHLTAAACA